MIYNYFLKKLWKTLLPIWEPRSQFFFKKSLKLVLMKFGSHYWENPGVDF